MIRWRVFATAAQNRVRLSFCGIERIIGGLRPKASSDLGWRSHGADDADGAPQK